MFAKLMYANKHGQAEPGELAVQVASMQLRNHDKPGLLQAP